MSHAYWRADGSDGQRDILYERKMYRDFYGAIKAAELRKAEPFVQAGALRGHFASGTGGWRADPHACGGTGMRRHSPLPLFRSSPEPSMKDGVLGVTPDLPNAHRYQWPPKQRIGGGWLRRSIYALLPVRACSGMPFLIVRVSSAP